MQSKFENGTLTVELCSGIDSSNSANVEKEIFDLIEKNSAKQAFIKDIPTAISYDTVKCGDKYGVVFELIDSTTLAQAMTENLDKFDEYMDKYVDVAKIIHNTNFSDVTSVHINDVYKKDFEQIKDLLTDEEWSSLMDFFEIIPNSGTMLHNDFHVRNIMLLKDELLLIDMGFPKASRFLSAAKMLKEDVLPKADTAKKAIALM